MKKKIITAFILVMAAVSMASCGGDNNSSKSDLSSGSTSTLEISVKASALVTAVMDSGVTFGEMTDVPADKVTFYYSEVKTEWYSDFSAKIEGSGGSADEVAVFKASSSDNTDNLKKALEARIEKQKKDFDGYVPAEYDKLCNSSVKTSGDYVYLIVSSDNSAADKAFKAALK